MGIGRLTAERLVRRCRPRLIVAALGVVAVAGAVAQERSVLPSQVRQARTGLPADVRHIDQQVPRVALVFGNAKYRHAPALDNPVNDARAVCARFQQLGFDTECVEDARSRRDMRDAIGRLLQRAKPGGVTLFYYAGHGVQKRGENFLLPVDARIDRVADVDEEGLPLGYLMEAVSEHRPALNLVIIDACRENMVDKARELALPRGFAAIDAPANSVVFYSTAPGRLALDRTGRSSPLSPFAAELVQRLDDGAAPLEEVFKGVIAGVQAATAGRQVPWVNSSFAGSFCFGACALAVDTAELTRISTEKQQVEAKLKQLESERDRREQDLAALSQRVKDLEAQTRHRQREVDTLRESGRQSSASYGEQQRQLQAELEKLRQANLDLSAERAAARVQRDEARRLEVLVQELSARMKQIEQLQFDNAQLRKRADDLNKEIDALQAQGREAGTRRAAPQKPEPPPPVPAF